MGGGGRRRRRGRRRRQCRGARAALLASACAHRLTTTPLCAAAPQVLPARRQGAMLLSSLRSSGPAALRAARLARPGGAASRVPLRCLASKGRKKEPEESEWQAAASWRPPARCRSCRRRACRWLRGGLTEPLPCALPLPCRLLRLAPGRAIRACLPTRAAHTARPVGAGVYSKTVNLPQTPFDMRANSVVREPQLQAWWAEHGIYEQLSRGNPGVRRRGRAGAGCLGMPRAAAERVRLRMQRGALLGAAHPAWRAVIAAAGCCHQPRSRPALSPPALPCPALPLCHGPPSRCTTARPTPITTALTASSPSRPATCSPTVPAARLHAARRPALRQRRPAHRPRAEQDPQGLHQPLPAAAGWERAWLGCLVADPPGLHRPLPAAAGARLSLQASWVRSRRSVGRRWSAGRRARLRELVLAAECTAVPPAGPPPAHPGARRAARPSLCPAGTATACPSSSRCCSR